MKEQERPSFLQVKTFEEMESIEEMMEYISKPQIKFEDFIIDENLDIDMIADVFPKNKLTLLHGQQGSGKSYSCIKALNDAKIKPLYVAIEETDGLQELDKDYLSYTFINAMYRFEKINLKDRVVIFDTYSRLHLALMNVFKDEQKIPELFEKMIEFYNITLIVIGHTSAFVGKDGIFRDNLSLARFAAEELFLEKTEYKATKARDAYIDYNLHVNKGRGTGGARIIKEWMRD